MMFSERLKLLRKKIGLTQEELAKLIGVERSSVGKYESTNVIPSSETLINIANILNTTTDYLLGRSEDAMFRHINTEASLSNNAQPQNAESLSERALRVARSWDELDETGKDEVLEAVGIARERMRSRMAGSRLQEG